MFFTYMLIAVAYYQIIKKSIHYIKSSESNNLAGAREELVKKASKNIRIFLNLI